MRSPFRAIPAFRLVKMAKRRRRIATVTKRRFPGSTPDIPSYIGRQGLTRANAERLTPCQVSDSAILGCRHSRDRSISPRPHHTLDIPQNLSKVSKLRLGTASFSMVSSQRPHKTPAFVPNRLVGGGPFSIRHTLRGNRNPTRYTECREPNQWGQGRPRSITSGKQSAELAN